MQCEHAKVLLHKQQTLKNKPVPRGHVFDKRSYADRVGAPRGLLWVLLQVKADINAGGEEKGKRNHAIIALRLDYW